MNKPNTLALAPLAFLLIPSACGEAGTAVVQTPDLHVVQREDLRITVREQAEVQAELQTQVKSLLEGRNNTLIYLIPEGSVVQQGEKLAELDVSEIEEKRANQAIAVAKAEATLEQARKSYEIMEKELEAEKTSAQSRLTIAEMELQKFLGKKIPNPPAEGTNVEGTNLEMLNKLVAMLEGNAVVGGAGTAQDAALDAGAVTPNVAAVAADSKYLTLPDTVRDLLGGEEGLRRDMGQMANRILEQIDQIRLAQADLVLKGDTLLHSESLAERDFITKNELEKDRLTYESQLSKVTLAWNDIDLLINYTLRQEKIRLEQDEMNARLDLQSVMAGNDARRVRERADLESNEAEYALAQERLENWNRQIENGTIFAPNPGLVVYAKQGRGGHQQPVEEGMEVRRRQTLIVLPDVTNMVAELKVHEADIDKVAPGQAATIEVDAYPERVFTGKVTRVSALPDSGSRFSNNDLKVYKTEVAFDGRNEEGILRPGMNATVEIMIGVAPDVIAVPSPAVQRQGAVHYVWKQTASGPAAVPVVVGRNNLTRTEVLQGVREGETVYLAQPAGAEVPEFPQPERGATAAILGDAAAAEADQRARRRQRERAAELQANPQQFLNELRPVLIERLPDHADQLEGDDYPRLLADPSFQDQVEHALQADPGLLEQWEAYRAGPTPGARGPGRGPGEGQAGRGGRGRGGDRGGRRGDGR